MAEEDFDPWWRDGICAEIGLEIFFGGASASVAIAKDACFLCPVQQQCLADVLEAHVEYGVFGGFARDERRRLVAEVDAGLDPNVAAARAIQQAKERRDAQRTPDPPDRDRARPRRARPHLRPRAAGHPQERPDVAALGTGAGRL